MQFGRYELVRKIGAGGMAEVWEARMSGPSGFAKACAIKKILPHLMEDPKFVEMFITEAKLVAELDHPTIVQIFDFGTHEDAYFIAMEFVRGTNIALLDRALAVPMPTELALYVGTETCRALNHAHSHLDVDGKPQPIIHRDVSPHNILASRDGEVKVADFGIAKFEPEIGETTAGVIKGKVRYLSPEQAREERVDARSDIFGLGSVLFEVLVGRCLIEGESFAQVYGRITQYEGPPTEALASLHPDVREILELALAADPNDRFGSAAEMEAALTTVLGAQGMLEARQMLGGLVRKISTEDDAAMDPSWERKANTTRETIVPDELRGRTRASKRDPIDDTSTAKRVDNPFGDKLVRETVQFAEELEDDEPEISDSARLELASDDEMEVTHGGVRLSDLEAEDEGVKSAMREAIPAPVYPGSAEGGVEDDLGAGVALDALLTTEEPEPEPIPEAPPEPGPLPRAAARVSAALRSRAALISAAAVLTAGVVATIAWQLTRMHSASQEYDRIEAVLMSPHRSDLENALRTLDALVPRGGARVASLHTEAQTAVYFRDPRREDLEASATAALSAPEDDAAWHRARVRLAIAERRVEDARAELQAYADAGGDPVIASLFAGEIALLARDPAGAQRAFEQAGKTARTPTEKAWAFTGLAHAFALQDDRKAVAESAARAIQEDARHPEAKALLAYGMSDAAALTVIAEDDALFPTQRALAHRLLALLTYRNKQTTASLRHLREAVALDPNDSETEAIARKRVAARWSKLDMDRWVLGLQALPAGEAFPETQAAEAALAAGNTREALAALDQALAKARHAPRTLLASARVHRAIGGADHFQKADWALAEALEQHPDNVALLLERGELERAEGKQDSALTTFRDLVARDPLFLPAQVAAGDSALAVHQLDEAERHYQAATRLAPERVDGWVGLAVARRKANDPQGALAPLEEAHKAAPDNARAQAELGRTWLDLGSTAKARPALTKALELDPHSVEARVGMGRLLVDENKLSEAEPLLESAVSEAPRNAAAAFQLGRFYAAAGRDDAARQSFERALSLDPLNAERYHVVAEYYWAKAEAKPARELLEKALELDAGRASSNELLADVLLETEEFDAALECLARAFAVTRDKKIKVETQLKSGDIWRERRTGADPAKARVHYRRVLKIDPKNAEAHYRLGQLDAATDPWGALKHLNKAKDIDPTLVGIYKQTGYVYKGLNNCRKALANFRIFVKRSPPGPERDEIQQELDTLGCR